MITTEGGALLVLRTLLNILRRTRQPSWQGITQFKTVLRRRNMVIYHGSIWVTEKVRIIWGRPGPFPATGHCMSSGNQSKFPLARKECVSTIKTYLQLLFLISLDVKLHLQWKIKRQIWVIESQNITHRILNPQAFKISEQEFQPNHFILLPWTQLMSAAMLFVSQHPSLSPPQLFLRPRLFSALAPYEVSSSLTLLLCLFCCHYCHFAGYYMLMQQHFCLQSLSFSSPQISPTRWAAGIIKSKENLGAWDDWIGSFQHGACPLGEKGLFT